MDKSINTDLENKLNSCLDEFFQIVSNGLKHYCKVDIGPIKLSKRTKLDDQKIQDKKDLNTTNGKYDLIEDWDYFYPCSDSPGVYLILDENGRILYVGESLVAIGTRISCHLGVRVENLPSVSFIEIFPNTKFSNEKFVPRYVVTIPFNECRFFAPAFEAFMINREKPPYNAILKNIKDL